MAAGNAVILCATPRSGSTLLCDLLTATGVCGRPHSYFRRQSIPDWMERFGVAVAPDSPGFDAAFLAAARAAGTDGSGTFGLRLMWETVDELRVPFDRLFPGRGTDAGRFRAAFGPGRYVFLARRDTVAQAVSRLRAEQSGLWHVHADGRERERVKPHTAPVYDGAALAAFVAAAEAGTAAWETWFAGNGIAPVRCFYEDIAADPAAELIRLLAALGRDPALAGGVAPATARLADAESDAWSARFRAEHNLPHGQ